MGDSLIRPLVVCEALSSGSARHDRITKRRAFQRNAVPEYWIIDGDAQAFEIWHPADDRPALVDDRLEWPPMRPPRGLRGRWYTRRACVSPLSP